MKSFTTLLFATLLVAAATASADNRVNTHSESIDANGAAVTTDTSRKDTTGWTGTRKSTAEEKTSVDPKGLNNKMVAKSTHESNVQKDGDYSKTDKTLHADGTEHEVTSEKSTSRHLMGGKTTTTTQTEEIDPKGLGNKHTAKVEKKVKENADGTGSTTITKKVDGDTVSETTSEVD